MPTQSTVKRLAAIDVGTNSIRLIVVEASPDGSYRLIDDEKEVTRLGQGMVRTGQLAIEAVETSVEVLARMKEIADGYNVELLRVIGTCAVREASNGQAFLDMVHDRAGLDIQIITPEEEGRLAFLSVKSAYDLRSLDSMVVDLGGGSTEIVVAVNGEIHDIYKLPLGAVRLTEQFQDEPNESTRSKLMRRCVRDQLKAHIGKDHISPQMLFGTGGTFTTLANMSFFRNNISTIDQSHPYTIRGYEMKRAEVQYMHDWLSDMPLRARMRIAGLNPDRAEIIVAGAIIIERLMKYVRVDTLRVHDRGIRDGLLLTMIGEVFPRSVDQAGPPDRMQFVRHLAVACKDERKHSEQVTALAMQIYDQLIDQLKAAEEPWAQPAVRELFRAGALLHDIGYSINYTRHHKHSYHLIVHSEMPGFTHRELEIIANVARYHRRSEPKLRHPGFEKLSSEDRAIVQRLAAILRIADGLDRAHSQFVEQVTVELRDGTAWFFVHAAADPVVDIWGAARKSQMFHKVFELDPRFEWARKPGEPTTSPESQS